MHDDTFYPYIRLELEPGVTAIVGANESGKSQFLDAIECALGYKTPTPADFCRYSDYFTVAETMRTPNFGLRFQDLTLGDSDIVSEITGQSYDTPPESLYVFHEHEATVTLYVNGEAYPNVDVEQLSGSCRKCFA